MDAWWEERDRRTAGKAEIRYHARILNNKIDVVCRQPISQLPPPLPFPSHQKCIVWAASPCSQRISCHSHPLNHSQAKSEASWLHLHGASEKKRHIELTSEEYADRYTDSHSHADTRMENSAGQVAACNLPGWLADTRQLFGLVDALENARQDGAGAQLIPRLIPPLQHGLHAALPLHRAGHLFCEQLFDGVRVGVRPGVHIGDDGYPWRLDLHARQDGLELLDGGLHEVGVEGPRHGQLDSHARLEVGLGDRHDLLARSL
mmetsp:Transcript_29225/g.72816  ORF Transcript_29225/g.72816 Transcript_29225/m.72816 type:complete len:261 (+) Transcript_29225:560-1342(+)